MTDAAKRRRHAGQLQVQTFLVANIQGASSLIQHGIARLCEQYTPDCEALLLSNGGGVRNSVC